MPARSRWFSHYKMYRAMTTAVHFEAFPPTMTTVVVSQYKTIPRSIPFDPTKNALWGHTLMVLTGPCLETNAPRWTSFLRVHNYSECSPQKSR